MEVGQALLLHQRASLRQTAVYQVWNNNRMRLGTPLQQEETSMGYCA